MCSASEGWLNPPLRFHDEPCRHKVLDLIGDLSMLARSGSQGLPVAHIVAYKVIFSNLFCCISFTVVPLASSGITMAHYCHCASELSLYKAEKFHGRLM